MRRLLYVISLFFIANTAIASQIYHCQIGNACDQIIKPNTISKWRLENLQKNVKYHCITRGFPKISWINYNEAAENGITATYNLNYPESTLDIDTKDLKDGKRNFLKLHFGYDTQTSIPAQVSLSCSRS